MSDSSDDYTTKLENRLRSLEVRIDRLEAALSSAGNGIGAAPPDNQFKPDSIPEEIEIESNVGHYGLAWMGNLVLFFGIIFITVYFVKQGHQALSFLTGYACAFLVFFLSFYLRTRNQHLSFILKMNALMLLFYVTLRLHFFSASPVIPDNILSSALLLAVIALQAYFSVHDRSQTLFLLSAVSALLTGFVTDSVHSIPAMVIVTAACSAWCYLKFKWEVQLIVILLLAYLSLFMWLMGNPMMGHEFQIQTSLHSVVFYLGGPGAIYSLLLLSREKDKSSDDFLTGLTFVNGIFFTLLLAFITPGFFSKNYVTLYSVLSLFCLIFSTVLHSRSEWKFGSAFYSLYGFLAMSIALYGMAGFPGVYFLLSFQSLAVVSMALWFRNRLIIVMNSLLFLSILIIYLISSDSAHAVNFSFAAVSFISAAVLNWKKERLELRTGILRNLYLAEGFVMVLLSLLYAVPKQFVTLSWAVAALGYFIAAFVLKNVKYRYLSLGTMVCAAFYFFLADLAKIEIIYRVLALLFLAAVSIGISMYYAARIKKSH